MISINQVDRNVYLVTVQEGTSSTTHQVTVWPSDLDRYAPDATPEELLEASFEFLLEREPKESILTKFELPVIERYTRSPCRAEKGTPPAVHRFREED